MIDRACTVYRFYDEDDALLYVGSSINCATRTGQHKVKDWWPEVVRGAFEHYSSKWEARQAETRIVQEEAPRYNRQRPKECRSTRLRELRESAGETKVQLAVALGLESTAAIERWERGTQEIPTSRARELARHFKVTLSYLQADEAEAA